MTWLVLLAESAIAVSLIVYLVHDRRLDDDAAFDAYVDVEDVPPGADDRAGPPLHLAVDEADDGRLTAEIVFCEVQPGTLRLDCVVSAGEGRGWPFSIALELPNNDSALSVAWAIGQWIATSAVVVLRLPPEEADHPYVDLTDGITTVRLETTNHGPLLCE
ncbi:MAG TPA: hypothetical protein VH419_01205 [Nocardioidaceae bacterium]